MSFSGRRHSLLLLLLLLAAPRLAVSQEPRFAIEPRTSLAWFQIDPHYSHLWGTTCPDDPNWQAGEGHSPGANVNYGWRKEAKASGRSDKRIPLYPRLRVIAACRPAVSGGIIAADTLTWRGVRGEVVIAADSLETGLAMRTAYMRRAILETSKHPRIRFVLDSLSGVVPGDSLTGQAYGTLELHGVHTPVSAPVTGWRYQGGWRIKTQLALPADALEKVYGMSRTALAMGTTLGRWQDIHMGIDIILKPAPGAESPP